MNRRSVLAILSSLLAYPFIKGKLMASNLANPKRMPVVFIGHGSPMNGIQENAFTKMLNQLGQRIARPQAILCISAHWMSEGTWITHMDQPKTIHDFYGFPQALFDVQYPAKGDVALADRITSMIKDPRINPDNEQWGLDHGTWTVLKHMYPQADVPVLQLSLYMAKPGDYHFHLGELLRPLRDQGILIVGSGNIVHNLRALNWEAQAKPYPWAIEFDQWAKDKIEKRDFSALISGATTTAAGKMSVPTWEHYYPLLYILGASYPVEKPKFEYEEIQNSSISMRCLSYGLA